MTQIVPGERRALRHRVERSRLSGGIVHRTICVSSARWLPHWRSCRLLPVDLSGQRDDATRPAPGQNASVGASLLSVVHRATLACGFKYVRL